jgi:hypothetical protein
MEVVKMHFTGIGSDPELFLFRNGQPISSIGLVPGSKKRPHKVSAYEAIQVDNVAVEFNTKPTLDPDEFMESVGVCYEALSKHLNKIDNTIQIVMIPSAEFPESELKTRAARRFGCEPDFNAWSGGINEPPESTVTFRSCGGHIHLGFSNPEDLDHKRMIRLMDAHVGLFTSLICGDKERMKLYGKAGCFRFTKYGVEYRTPSNTWLTEDRFVYEVFKRTKEAVEAYNRGEDADFIVMEAINSADKEFIEEIINEKVTA